MKSTKFELMKVLTENNCTSDAALNTCASGENSL